tara:strand:+ start:898 stop:1230 length:333 start_codon:yes stop_codon:yes gene_type:complete
MDKINIEEIKSKLISKGFSIESEKRLGNNTGAQLRLSNGSIVDAYDKGTIQVQGVSQVEVKEALGLIIQAHFSNNLDSLESNTQTQTNHKIFVVYGHDENARNQLDVSKL